MNTKASLRELISLKRKSLSEKEQLESGESLVKLWNSIEGLYRTKKIALYWPVNGEILTNSLISHLLKDGSKCFLPIIAQDKENNMLEFAPFEVDSPLTNNRFDISEPSTSTRVDLNELDIIFLPCVCFDSKGNRIGMGGGFYDKTLDQLSNNQKPQLILLAYDFQEVESCFPESHDIKADACLTPNKFLKFRE